MPSINLLRKKEAESVEDVRLKKYVYTGTFGGFLILILMSFTVFVVSLSVSGKAKDYAAIEKSWVDKISSMSEIESLNLVLKQKLGAVKKVKSPFDFENVFTVLDSLTPLDVSVVSLDINNDGLMGIDGESGNSTALMSFLDGLTTSLGANLKRAVLNNLILSKDGSYRFSLALEFIKNK